MQSSGYSGTPLEKKLGIKPGYKILMVNEPKHYLSLFRDFPEVNYLDAPKEGTADFIHAFFTKIETLEIEVPKLKTVLKQNGMLWVSWPKGSSNIKTDLNRDLIRKHILTIGLVDVKVAAIDADWSGLKFMYRIKDRK